VRRKFSKADARGSTSNEKAMSITAARGSTCHIPSNFAYRFISIKCLAVLFAQLYLSVSPSEGFLHMARHHHHTEPADTAAHGGNNSTVSRVKRAQVVAETNLGVFT